MRIVTWNVHALRSFRGKVRETLDALDADIVCLQETKILRAGLEEEFAVPEGYDVFYSFHEPPKGYCGVGTFCSRKRSPFAVPLAGESGLTGCLGGEPNFREEDGFTEEELTDIDREGRIMVTDHGPFVLINVYVPCTTTPARMDFKLRFCLALQRKIEGIRQAGRNVVVVGDLNIAYLKIDHCAPEKHLNNTLGWYSHPARNWLISMLSLGGGPLEDAFRMRNPSADQAYTCWSKASSARETNYGTRIDHALIDMKLAPLLVDCTIRSDVEGSDHCPVSVEFDESEWADRPLATRPSPPGCARFYDDIGLRQQSLTQFVVPAKRRPEVGLRPSQPAVNKRLKQATLGLSVDPSKKPTQEVSKESNGRNRNDNEMVRGATEFIDTKSDDVSRKEPAIKSGSTSAWKKLLSGPRKPPRCTKHGERTVLREVKKDGPNKGKKFFVCHRPEGSKDHPKYVWRALEDKLATVLQT